MTPTIAFLLGALWGAACVTFYRLAFADNRQPPPPPVDLSDPTIPCDPPVPSDLLELEEMLREVRINSGGGTA